MVVLEAEAGGPTAAASRLGWDQPQWSNLRNGAADSKTGKRRGMHKSTARKIESAFLRPEYWLDVQHDDNLPVVSDDVSSSQIPHLSAKGSMGIGELMLDEEEVIDRITLKADWLSSNLPGCRVADLAVISGRGNSMSPTFNDGDLLLVDTGIKGVSIDGVYVLSAHNRLFIKTVRQRIDGGFEISSDNPSVKTVDVLNGDHQVTVHGRVVWAWNGKKL